MAMEDQRRSPEPHQQMRDYRSSLQENNLSPNDYQRIQGNMYNSQENLHHMANSTVGN